MCAVTAVKTIGRDLDADKAFALHNACFDDERAWFDAFLRAAEGQQYLAYGDYLGGLFLPDVSLGAYRGKYVYALGVHPAHRGKGIARVLLDVAKELSNDFTLICAADEKLAKTYAKYGFDRFVGGTVPVGAMRGAQMDTSAYKTPCAYADATNCGGVFLNETLFAFALRECGAKLYTDGEHVIAKAENGVYAAYGMPAKAEQKAQMYVKTNIDTKGIHADLILEVE